MSVQNMKKYVIDCKTGNAGSVPLTAAEIEALEDERAMWELKAPERERQATIAELAQTDAKMGRVVEDVINALLSRGAIYLNELPADAVRLLADRKAMRGRL